MNRRQPLTLVQKLRNYAVVFILVGFGAAMGLEAASGDILRQLGLTLAGLIAFAAGGCFWLRANVIEARQMRQVKR